LPRRSSPGDPEQLLAELKRLLTEFEAELASDGLRAKVKALIPAVHTLRDIGSSLIPSNLAESARDRILAYFRKYPRRVIEGDELMVVAGIGEWARRIRELRVQFGWKIASGHTIREMVEVEDLTPELEGQGLRKMGPNDYILLREEQDLEAAYRWSTANTIRKRDASVKDKILEYFRANVGKRIMNEELRYVAGNKTEWARRVRELRTEEGWPVFTKQSGRPDLDVGEYVLEADRQSFVHDRQIPDSVRREVLRRDGYRCTSCGWHQEEWSTADPRFLELHHVRPHAEGGENIPENLTTLCNVCHDEAHRD